MQTVMTNAWEIARKGQSNFGGNVKEYFSKALKLAWAMFKKEKEINKKSYEGKKVATFEQVFQQYYNHNGFRKKGVKVSKWENHGKRRIYFNDSEGNTLGFIAFDENDVTISTNEEIATLRNNLTNVLTK